MVVDAAYVDNRLMCRPARGSGARYVFDPGSRPFADKLASSVGTARRRLVRDRIRRTPFSPLPVCPEC